MSNNQPGFGWVKNHPRFCVSFFLVIILGACRLCLCLKIGHKNASFQGFELAFFLREVISEHLPYTCKASFFF